MHPLVYEQKMYIIVSIEVIRCPDTFWEMSGHNLHPNNCPELWNSPRNCPEIFSQYMSQSIYPNVYWFETHSKNEKLSNWHNWNIHTITAIHLKIISPLHHIPTRKDTNTTRIKIRGFIKNTFHTHITLVIHPIITRITSIGIFDQIQGEFIWSDNPKNN